MCEDYCDLIQENLSEEEAWWEVISTYLMNADIDPREAPYVIVAQIIKDCKKFFEDFLKTL